MKKLERLKMYNFNEKIVLDQKAIENIEKIKAQIREMLKKRNKDWKSTVIETAPKETIEARNQIWKHLQSVLTTLEYPTIDFSWKEDKSITHHTEGRKSHSVEYKTKIIDLGDNYDSSFWAEANYIFCKECKKHIRKQIVIFNDNENQCSVREMV